MYLFIPESVCTCKTKTRGKDIFPVGNDYNSIFLLHSPSFWEFRQVQTHAQCVAPAAVSRTRTTQLAMRDPAVLTSVPPAGPVVAFIFVTSTALIALQILTHFNITTHNNSLKMALVSGSIAKAQRDQTICPRIAVSL